MLTEFRFWTILFAIVIGGSLLVGIYPAVLTSKYNPVVVLKGKFYGSHNGIITRKIFSVVQFILAIILIAGSLIVANQLSFMRNQPLGYDKEHTLIVRMPSLYDLEKYPERYQLQKEFASNPAITSVGLSTEIPGESLKRTVNVNNLGDEQQSAEVFLSQVDHHFFNAYKIPLIAGRNFNQQDSADFFPIDGVSFPHQVPVIVNESFLKTVNLQTKEDALGKLINFKLEGNEIRGEIVGVSSNYHQTSLKDPYQPTLYIFPSRTEWRYFTINLSDVNLQKTMAFVEQSYRSLFPDNPFEYFFQEDYFNEQYKSDQRLSKIFNVFTALTVFISCLGILGLLHFIIRIRYKEIGIRRVLGASVISIMLLFYKDLFKLIVIATVIAVPLVYTAGSEWLNNFAFHTTLHPLIFILPSLILIAITLGVVATQTLKTTVTNPVNALNSE